MTSRSLMSPRSTSSCRLAGYRPRSSTCTARARSKRVRCASPTSSATPTATLGAGARSKTPPEIVERLGREAAEEQAGLTGREGCGGVGRGLGGVDEEGGGGPKPGGEDAGREGEKQCEGASGGHGVEVYRARWAAAVEAGRAGRSENEFRRTFSAPGSAAGDIF